MNELDARMSGGVCYINHISAEGTMEDLLNKGQGLRYIHIHNVITREHTRTPNPDWSPEVEVAWIEGWNQAKEDWRDAPVVGFWNS